MDLNKWLKRVERRIGFPYQSGKIVREDYEGMRTNYLGEATALMPGASRNGMTLAAARLRGFDREDANELSRHVALPVIVGAAVLKGTRLARRGLPPGAGGALATGAAAAFGSTLVSAGLIRLVERDRSLLPYAAYRAALGTLVLGRLRRDRWTCEHRGR